MREEEEEVWDEVEVGEEERYEDEYDALGVVADRIDMSLIRGDNLPVGAVTAFQRRGDIARRRSAFIAEGTGAYFAHAEATVLRMPSPAREIVLNFLFSLMDYVSGEEGRTLTSMLAGHGGKLSMYAPHMPHVEQVAEEEGTY